jgi:hypothetical protein
MEQSEHSPEAAAVLEVIVAESTAFWEKDYDAWARFWVQAPYIRMMGWWERGGISVIEGWEALSSRIRRNMLDNPSPNPSAGRVRRSNINLRLSETMAWVSFEQHGIDSGEPTMDMPGLSHETRILEKHGGAWKLVYACWLLEGGRGEAGA